MRRLGHIASIVLGLWALGVAQGTGAPGPQAPAGSLADEVRQGDWRAIRKAGASGDPSFIPLLRDLVARTGTDDDTVIAKGEAHFALAKLGDARELQARWCEAVSDAPAMNDQRVLGLNVGGWFSIHALSQFLKPEFSRRYAAALDTYLAKAGRTDVATPSLERDVVDALQSLVPHPPFRVGPYDSVGPFEADAWLRWIRIHEPELRAMKPTGEGVTLSLAACEQAAR
jgi:hypothetical protein